MNSIQFMNRYGITALLIGLFSCIVCGILKLPIVNGIRNKASSANLDGKKVADRIRNVCNLIVAITAILSISFWYIAFDGVKTLSTTKLYAEMLTAFTTAKLIYMLYEGVGSVSIKRLAHTLLERIKNCKGVKANDKVVSIIEIIQKYLTDDVCLPLTMEQTEGLAKLLEGRSFSDSKEVKCEQ